MGEIDVNAEILQRLTRVETKLDMQLDARDKAAEALDKAKSAHHRLEEHKQRIDEMQRHYDNEIRLLNTRVEVESSALAVLIKTENQERKLDKRWTIGTMLTAAGLIVAIIKLL